MMARRRMEWMDGWGQGMGRCLCRCAMLPARRSMRSINPTDRRPVAMPVLVRRWGRDANPKRFGI